MNKQFYLNAVEYPEIQLRTIREKDQDNLRGWKNENRERFFYQDIISKEAQLEWFRGYLTRDRDYMFIVKTANNKIGCMGIRLIENVWDIYNVILGETALAGKGYMSQAINIIYNFAHNTKPFPIFAKVLSNNPAISWYIKNGFKIIIKQDNYVEIKLDEAFFKNVLVTKINL